jgi:nucleotide-binding universal stress UspA family protein
VKVLVGYVRTPEARAALEAAIAEAQRRDATLVVAHASRGSKRERETDPAVRAYHAELRDIEERLSDSGIDFQVRELIRHKPPAEDLLAFAGENAVELIVIGVRRRSPVGKLVLGSNAQDIILKAECPVLAVKAPAAPAA